VYEERTDSPLPREMPHLRERDVAYFECGDWLYRVECIRPMPGSSAPYGYIISYHPEVPETMPANPSVALYWKDVYSYRSRHAPDTLDAYMEAFELIEGDFRLQDVAGVDLAADPVDGYEQVWRGYWDKTCDGSEGLREKRDPENRREKRIPEGRDR